MTIEGQNGVDHVDRKAQWPHFLNTETRFCLVAQRVTNMRWGRRCWDCPVDVVVARPSPVMVLLLLRGAACGRGVRGAAAVGGRGAMVAGAAAA